MVVSALHIVVGPKGEPYPAPRGKLPVKMGTTEAEVLLLAATIKQTVVLRDSHEGMSLRRYAVVNEVSQKLIGVKHVPCAGVMHFEMQMRARAMAGIATEGYELSGRDRNIERGQASIGNAGLVAILKLTDNAQVMLRTTNGRALLFDTALLLPKTTRNTQGVQVMTLKAKNAKVEKAYIVSDEEAETLAKYRSKTIPVAGSLSKDLEDPDQLSF